MDFRITVVHTGTYSVPDQDLQRVYATTDPVECAEIDRGNPVEDLLGLLPFKDDGPAVHIDVVPLVDEPGDDRPVVVEEKSPFASVEVNKERAFALTIPSTPHFSFGGELTETTARKLVVALMAALAERE